MKGEERDFLQKLWGAARETFCVCPRRVQRTILWMLANRLHQW